MNASLLLRFRSFRNLGLEYTFLDRTIGEGEFVEIGKIEIVGFRDLTTDHDRQVPGRATRQIRNAHIDWHLRDRDLWLRWQLYHRLHQRHPELLYVEAP